MEELDHVTSIHDRLDFDRNGKVDQNDFSAESWSAVRKFDADQDDELSSEELRAMIRPLDEVRPPDEIGPEIPNNRPLSGTLTLRKVVPENNLR